MISLDWKERLKKDTIDFFERKLPQRDYDIDIVYNAYPQRIDNNIPHAVITLVARTLAGKLTGAFQNYMDFYDYLLVHKGENGSIIFADIMARAVKSRPDVFMPYLHNKLFEVKEQKWRYQIIDKAIFPLMKKEHETYLERILQWIKKDDEEISLGLIKMLEKLMKYDPSLVKPVFKKMETSWLYATPIQVKMNIRILKTIYKIDRKYYFSIYEPYKNTRNPVFAEILFGAMVDFNDAILEMIEHWSQSGNIKLKKIGQSAQKVAKRKGFI
jgi:hypothetical protein